MKILYGIQGTGHGHVSRAREILPYLAERASVDVLLSGYNCKLGLDGFNINRKRGISFEYDKHGSVSIIDTALSLDPVSLVRDIQHLDVDEYDLVISDFEPITAWASITSQTPCVGLSHQAAFLSEKIPRPDKRSPVAEQIMKHFAPCDADIGFHFKRYDKGIEPPIIRKNILHLNPCEKSHVTVYLPAFDHETVVSILMNLRDIEWHIFSPLCEIKYVKGNVRVFPVGHEPFLKSLEGSMGVLTSAGFETCAEAMYLGKKLFTIPIKNQYEQLCNAAALGKLGVRVSLQWGKSLENDLKQWIFNDHPINLDEIADVEKISEKLVRFARKHTRKRTGLNSDSKYRALAAKI